ncbi:uncharacterized protein TNCV_2995291 [Trichonephila clavipes]|nr:uncharacterized protein TNCV_2995291 [Trichonephila clavipes]
MQEKISAGVRTWGPTPVPPQGIKSIVPSPVPSKTHKYRRQEFNSSQRTESIAGPSHQQMIRHFHPSTEESGQTTAVRSCPYYLRSCLKEPEGMPEEQRSTGIKSLLQNSLKGRSLSMKALDGDPADRSE